MGYHRIVNPLHGLLLKLLDLCEKFELRILKTVRMHVDITFFE